MKANYTNFLNRLAAAAGISSISLLVTLPSQAKEVLNPTPNIFAEAAYSRTPRVLINTNYTPAEPAPETAKQKKKPAAKKPGSNVQKPEGGKPLNPAPSIFNEAPYSRGSRTSPSSVSPAPGSSSPSGVPEAAPTEVPTAPTTLPPIPESTPPSTLPPSGETPGITPPSTTPDKPSTPSTPDKPSSGSPSETPGAGKPGSDNILKALSGKPQFKTLTKALEAAGLTETLQGAGPFTIFAPTDAAFAKLPQDAVRDLLKKENKEVLVKLLTYHVVNGNVLSSDLKTGEVKSLQGDPISVKVDAAKGGVTVNDAKVMGPDMKGTNGVIHEIDNVILPPSL
jgi:uncharacterized surface protein with fasciclin (FAS1) repeats